MKCTLQLIKLLHKLPHKVHVSLLNWVILLSVLTIMAGCSSSKNNVRPLSSAGVFVEKTTDRSLSVSDDKLKKYKRALAKMKKGEYKNAGLLFKEVSDVYPNISGPYINMGIISLKQNNYIQAENNFKLAIDVKPNNAEAYNLLGVAYRQQGRFLDARDAYKKSLLIDKNMAKSYLNLGILNDLYLNDFAEAKKNYKKYQKLTSMRNSDATTGNKNISRVDTEKVDVWLADINLRIQAGAQ